MRSSREVRGYEPSAISNAVFEIYEENRKSGLERAFNALSSPLFELLGISEQLLDFVRRLGTVFRAVKDDDIEAVFKTAAHTHIPHNRHRPLNALSSLPSSKAKLKIAIKQRIRHLAGAYISLATFVDDDEVAFMERNPTSKRTKAIYVRVLRDMEKAEKEMLAFKIF